MLPGKSYRPEDIVNILRKRFWLIIVPAALISAATAGIARKLPDVYRSTAMIQVIPPQVPGNLVTPSTTVSLQNRLLATTQTILSRTRLERLILDLNLYEAERKRQIMEDVVAEMRKDIHIDPAKGDTFTVTYDGRNPSMVMKVTESLASYFKDENMREGQRRAEDTTSFVESAVDEAKRKLQATEDKLRQYKLLHAGELPQQLQANMQAVQNINQQLTSLAQQMNNDNNAKVNLERSISQLEDMANVGTAQADPGGTAAQRLAAAKTELAMAVDVRGLKPDNPDYKKLQAAVKRLESEAQTEALKAPLSGGASPAESQRLARLAGYKDDLDRVKQNLELGKEREKQLRQQANVYQAYIDKVPMRDAELTELLRDYDTQNKLYQELFTAKEKSSMTVNAERRQIGEQFVLVDAARMPERPFSPNRLMINFLGILGGLGVGLALVALIEYRDTTFKTDDELATALALPVLAVVPLMKADSERKADFRKALMLNVGLASVVLVCLAVLTYSFVFIR
jgi:succinoglycan biosynthesis transport protein ExoP